MAVATDVHRLAGATAPDLEQARSWIGDRVTDTFGSALGRLEDVWVDAVTGEPAWLLIREGRFGGGKPRLIPFDGATGGGDRVWVPHERATVRSAPELGVSGLLSFELADRLRAHYS